MFRFESSRKSRAAGIAAIRQNHLFDGFREGVLDRIDLIFSVPGKWARTMLDQRPCRKRSFQKRTQAQDKLPRAGTLSRIAPRERFAEGRPNIARHTVVGIHRAGGIWPRAGDKLGAGRACFELRLKEGQFDAVFLAVGAHLARRASIPARPGIWRREHRS
jgi:hypothetical protein